MEFHEGAAYLIGDTHAAERHYRLVVGQTLVYIKHVIFRSGHEYHLMQDKDGVKWGIQGIDILPLPIHTNAEATTLLRGDY